MSGDERSDELWFTCYDNVRWHNDFPQTLFYQTEGIQLPMKPNSGWGKSINLLGFNGKCYITYRKYYGTIMVFWTWYYGKCCIAYKKLPLYYHKSDTTYKNTMLLLCFLGYSTMANVRSHTKRCHCTTIKVMPLTKIPWCYYVFLGGHGTIW